MQCSNNEPEHALIVEGKGNPELSNDQDTSPDTVATPHHLTARRPLRKPTTPKPATTRRLRSSSRSPGRAAAARADHVGPTTTLETGDWVGSPSTPANVQAAVDAHKKTSYGLQSRCRQNAEHDAQVKSEEEDDSLQSTTRCKQNTEHDAQVKSEEEEDDGEREQDGTSTPAARLTSMRRGPSMPQMGEQSAKASYLPPPPPSPAAAGDKRGHGASFYFLPKQGLSSDLLAAVILLIALLCIWLAYLREAPPPLVRLDAAAGQPPTSVHRWVEQVALLSAKFPYQRPLLWKVMRATVNRMLVQGQQPAVILVTAGEQQRADAACLLAKLADAVHSATGSQTAPQLQLDGRWLAKLEADEAKRRLGAMLDTLRPAGRRDTDVAVVVLNDVQQLRPLTAMLLHGFCDNENAPRKAAVFLLLLVTPQPPPDADLSLHAERQLWLAWGETLGEDIFNALMGRIAGNVVAVAAEGNTMICPRQTV